jgi:hypothetical protein
MSKVEIIYCNFNGYSFLWFCLLSIVSIVVRNLMSFVLFGLFLLSMSEVEHRAVYFDNNE